MCTLGFPGNLGDPSVFGRPGRSSIRPRGQPLTIRPKAATKSRVRIGTAERRQRSDAGGTQGSRSHLIVPVKLGNTLQWTQWREAGGRSTEPCEGTMSGDSSLKSISTKLTRIATLSKERPAMVWTTLAHNIDIKLLTEAFRQTRKDGAPGIDGQTAQQYSENLEGNLQSLLDRFKSGKYRASAVRRVHLPKGKGQTRPIGIPTFEDKVLQRAVTMVLEAVYEQDFLDCSYGFRPKRSQHQAIHSLREGLMEMKGGYVLELDFSKFFDTLDHGHLRTFLDKRIRDGVIRRTINKWLKAGVLEGKQQRWAYKGTPQGGVISPLLANVYLHEVLDLWFSQDVLPRMRGKAFMVRYADDAVLVFEREGDAHRVLEVLPKRAGRFNLKLHPEKTRLIPFKRPAYREGNGRDVQGNRPGSFVFLGFTHHWAKSQRGNWVILRRTASGSLSSALHRISSWCQKNRHLTIGEQHASLSTKLRGHYSYFGIRGNSRSLGRFWYEVRIIWRKWLNRRSDRAKMTWERYNELLERYQFPSPLLVHPNV